MSKTRERDGEDGLDPPVSKNDIKMTREGVKVPRRRTAASGLRKKRG